MKQKNKASSPGTNYLLWLVGGIFLLALIVVAFFALMEASPLFPLQGCVGIVEIDGPIISKDIDATLLSDEVKGAETMAKEIASAKKRPEVKSILVIIDSPGGSVVGSKELYEALRKVGKPTVAYINELGASGGYYVAAGADYIVAQPDSITGSIGARATFVDLSGLFEKIGYSETTIKTGEMKDIGTYSRPMTAEERAVIEGIINESFQQFRSDIEKSRGGRLDRAEFQKILDARILSGRQAKRIGLVDYLGNKEFALQKAAALGNITAEKPPTCALSSSEERKGLFGRLFSEELGSIANRFLPKILYQ
ncbi:MAG: signal peptide peptidase SppA [Candidatus Micrarchaeota archaeon]|nr:signal peptide peptidase SppA [Candidatus Micrarchaeota archaeon]